METTIVGSAGRMVTYPYLGSDADHSVEGRVYYGRPGRDGTEDEIAARIPRRRVLAVLREYDWRAVGRTGAQHRYPTGTIYEHVGTRARVEVPMGPHPLADAEARVRIADAVATVDGSKGWVILDVMGIDR